MSFSIYLPERRRARRLALAAAVLLCLAPGQAQAHLVTTGLGPVYDGIGHFWTSIEDIFPAVALAVLAGLRGPKPGRTTLWALPLAWLLGGVAGLLGPDLPEWPRPVLSGIVAVTFLIPGGLVAADLALPAGVVAGLAAVIGVVHGFLDAQGMLQEGLTVTDGILQFFGIAVILFVLVALLAALVISLRYQTARTIFRVAGSWIAASGVLLMGWSLIGVG
jgi:urease accessory protein